jgi:tetratricopeptide (TPR) repeat protein
LINQICDVSLTYGFAEQTGVITNKLVAQAALDRSRGGILPLGKIDELGALAVAADDPSETPLQMPPPTVPLFQVDAPVTNAQENQSAVTPDMSYGQGVSLRKEGRFSEAIEAFNRAGQDRSYSFKSAAQAGLCYMELEEHLAAIDAFRRALGDPSGSRNEVVNVQYFLARTLESIGEIEEASILYQRIVRSSPAFKDSAARVKQLMVQKKRLKNGSRHADSNETWFSHALDSLHHLIGSRR